MCEPFSEKRRLRRLLLITAALLSYVTTPAIAQESRTEERVQQQDQKPLAPSGPSGGERFFEWLENYVTSPNQWYVTFGNLMPSSGLAPGAGYRGVLGDVARFNVRGAWSIRNYTLADGVIEIPFADERFAVSGRARWRDGTQLPFYGLGDASLKAQRASYALQEVNIGGGATYRPSSWFNFGARAEAMLLESGTGDGRYRTVEAVFAPTTVPGLLASPDYLHAEATAAIDWRESEGYTRRGGYYAVSAHRYDDRSDNRYTFNEVHLDVRQFIPRLNEHWVIALRGQVRTTNLDGDQQVPFFLLPSLGGSTTLRAYPDGRFRDRHALLLSGEYRWIPGRVLDMALFVDAGKVTARRGDLDLEGLNTSYGIGARFHAPAATVLRTEVAHGREGYRFHFAFGKAF
jgi:hypothetical protein